MSVVVVSLCVCVYIVGWWCVWGVCGRGVLCVCVCVCVCLCVSVAGVVSWAITQCSTLAQGSRVWTVRSAGRGLGAGQTGPGPRTRLTAELC